MSSFLQSVNEATFFVPFVKSSQLEVNKKFQVNRFSKEDSQFGKQVVVDCGDFKTSLPQRFTSQFTEGHYSQPGVKRRKNNFYD
jgi:hypothetical protein